MTSINVANLVFTMQQKISSTTNEQDLFYYSKVLQQLRSGKVYVVNAITDLPAAAANVGELYYVVLNTTLYVSNAVRGWSALGTTPLNQIWNWGNGVCGRLGDNTVISRSSPVREITSSTTWCQTSAGWTHTSAIKTDGTLWSWGSNFFGQLGNNTVTDQSSPVREITSSTTWCQTSAGRYNNSAVKTDGSLWSWGYNRCGALGDNTIANRSSPVREITSSTNWFETSAGYKRANALKTDGSLWVWGYGRCGRLGDNGTLDRSSPVREITSSTTWCQTSIGFATMSAVKTDGTLWSWGSNSCGVLGDGTVIARSSPVREATFSTAWCQTSAGDSHTSALKTDGTLWSWGYNGGGLGDGTVVSRCFPVREITSSNTWCQTSAGANFTSALKIYSTLWSWGANDCGQLGDTTVTSRSSPVREITSSNTWWQTSAGGGFTSALK